MKAGWERRLGMKIKGMNVMPPLCVTGKAVSSAWHCAVPTEDEDVKMVRPTLLGYPEDSWGMLGA